MTYNPKDTRYANVMSTAAAIASAYAIFKQNKVTATGGTVNVILPDALMQLLAAEAQDVNTIAQWLLAYTPGSNGQGWPPNCNGLAIYRVDMPVANTGQNLLNTDVPDDFEVILKASPLNAVGSIVYVATSKSDAETGNGYPLVPNEFKGWKITNANLLWVAATAAPASVNVSMEQRV